MLIPPAKSFGYDYEMIMIWCANDLAQFVMTITTTPSVFDINCQREK
jgi:hypothetical protein